MTDQEIPVFKFEEDQIVRIKYNPSIHIFLVGREFDTKAKKIFYHGRVFAKGQINQNFTRFTENELESILTPEQESALSTINEKTQREQLSKILGELAGAASLCWKEKPLSEFDAAAASKFVEEAIEKILNHPVKPAKHDWQGETVLCEERPGDRVGETIRSGAAKPCGVGASPIPSLQEMAAKPPVKAVEVLEENSGSREVDPPQASE